MSEPPAINPSNPASGAGFGIRFAARAIDTIYGLVIGLFGGVLGAIIITLLLEPAGVVAPGWQERMAGLNLAGWGAACWVTSFTIA